MSSLHWFNPVSIWESHSVRRSVSSVEEAAETLLGKWPKDHLGDPEHRAAREACLRALDGTGTVEAARQAFTDAADAAGITD